MQRVLRIFKDDDRAVIPTRGHPTDSGLDLTVISVHKDLGNGVKIYDTGLIIEPSDQSFYVDLVVRSSLMKHGHTLANNVGIIDTTYRGRVMVALLKFDKESPDIELPMRVAQLIPRAIIPIKVEETITEPTSTKRAKGGFGSTNK